jgi:uncharacterized protein
MTSLEIWGYPASLGMGLALGLTGGGGSILTVPILVYLFGIGAYHATTYSLALVGLVALWGAWNAYRSGDLHLRRALSFGVPGVAGVLVSRRLLLPQLPESFAVGGLSFTQNSLLLIAFSVLMLAASASMILGSRADATKSAASAMSRDRSVSALSLTLGGFVVGIVAGFVGAGGGFLIVPALVNLAKLDMRQAVGTSLFVISLQSLLGVLGDYKSLSQIDPVLFVLIAGLALVGMSVGGRFRSRISAPKLKLGFGIFVLMMGTLIFLQELKKGSL